MNPQLLEQLAQWSQGLAQQQYDWGLNQFNQNSQLTDQLVNDYLGKSQVLTGMGTSDLARYQGIFQPVENQLVADAASYAGAPRIQAEMGRAGATAAQSAEAGRQNALADLRAYGIDPSAGRYASLDAATRAQQAASVAGAQNQARLATEATGRGLRSEAIQVGQRYPGQIANELAAALSADTGAINARLANTNTGVNALGRPQDWFGEALKAQTAANQFELQNRMLPRSGMAPGGAGATKPGQSGGGGGTPYGGPYGPQAPSMVSSGAINPGYQYGAGSNVPKEGDGASGFPYDYGAGAGDPFGVAGGAAGPGDAFTDYGTGVSAGQTGDTSGYGYDQGYTPDWGGGGGNSYDTPIGGGDYEFQQGGEAPDQQGAIPMPGNGTSGGFVSRSYSPSGGVDTDDVPARLNAHEYVIPRDVSLWKGQEFFQNLINKSRDALGQATAKPAFKPAIAMR